MLVIKARHCENEYNLSEEIYILNIDLLVDNYSKGDEVRKIATMPNNMVSDPLDLLEAMKVPGYHPMDDRVTICSVKSRWADFMGVRSCDIEEKKNFPVELPKLLENLG